MWMDVDMRAHLSRSGQGEMWDRSIVPAMKAIAQQMIKCATDNVRNRWQVRNIFKRTNTFACTRAYARTHTFAHECTHEWTCRHAMHAIEQEYDIYVYPS